MSLAADAGRMTIKCRGQRRQWKHMAFLKENLHISLLLLSHLSEGSNGYPTSENACVSIFLQVMSTTTSSANERPVSFINKTLVSKNLMFCYFFA